MSRPGLFACALVFVVISLAIAPTCNALPPVDGPFFALEGVSVSSTGIPANDDCDWPAISAEGRYVAFLSRAGNLVPQDAGGSWQAYLRDRVAGATSMVSVSSSGAPGNGHTYQVALSANGRYVVFQSAATNLVPGDSNDALDIFCRDRLAGSTVRVSLAANGGQLALRSDDPAVSADGRFVAFGSADTAAVAGDNNWSQDVFVYDRDPDRNGSFTDSVGRLERISLASNGQEGNASSLYPAISANGRFVAFLSYADNLVAGDTNSAPDVFVRDRDVDDDGAFDEPGAVSTTRVSVSSGGAQAAGGVDYERPTISADGRLVAFRSSAANLVPGDTNNAADVFVHDLVTGQTVRVSVSSGGAQGNDDAVHPSAPVQGRWIAFQSEATNLVANDTNGRLDVFVHDLVTRRTVRLSEGNLGQQGWYSSAGAVLSADGAVAAFATSAYNIVPPYTSRPMQVVARTRADQVWLPVLLRLR